MIVFEVYDPGSHTYNRGLLDGVDPLYICLHYKFADNLEHSGPCIKCGKDFQHPCTARRCNGEVRLCFDCREGLS